MFGEANRLLHPILELCSEIRPLELIIKTGGFSKDIGKLVLAGQSEVRGLLGLDYNTDGYEDILVVSGDGKVRLIQNNGGYDQLKDQGFILNVKNGIQDFTKADLIMTGKWI